MCVRGSSNFSLILCDYWLNHSNPGCMTSARHTVLIVFSKFHVYSSDMFFTKIFYVHKNPWSWTFLPADPKSLLHLNLGFNNIPASLYWSLPVAVWQKRVYMTQTPFLKLLLKSIIKVTQHFSSWPTRLYVLLKSSQPYPSGCFSPTIRGTVSFSTDRHSSTPTGSSWHDY